MLLAVDIGNTNIVVALFHENEIIHEWRLHSDPKRTADEYNSMILSFFRDNGISQSYIKSGVLSSVVPLLIGPFIRLMENIIGRKPIILGPSIYDKLPVTIPKSAIHEIGTDLVANSVQAFMEYKKPCIVADFGTALTFTAIDNKGNIQGVAIAPGIKTAVNSLFNNTAPSSSLGRNTIHSIQSGIILGYKGLVESLISQIKNDLSKETDAKQEEIIVIATGGLNSVLKPITDVFEIVDKQLTLKGLKRIADLF